MNLRPYKFVVTAVAQQIDDDGNVTGEAEAEPVVVYGCAALTEWAEGFPDKLAQAENRDGPA